MVRSNEEIRETILVVDDDPSVLKIVAWILESAHFRVLKADNAARAIEIAIATEGEISLLLSDVDMPVMSGPDLGQELKKTRPDIHVVLMSGGQQGNLLVLNYGWAYIQQPFVRIELIKMIKDVLHQPNQSQPGGQRYDTRKNVDHK